LKEETTQKQNPKSISSPSRRRASPPPPFGFLSSTSLPLFPTAAKHHPHFHRLLLPLHPKTSSVNTANNPPPDRPPSKPRQPQHLLLPSQHRTAFPSSTATNQPPFTASSHRRNQRWPTAAAPTGAVPFLIRQSCPPSSTSSDDPLCRPRP